MRYAVKLFFSIMIVVTFSISLLGSLLIFFNIQYSLQTEFDRNYDEFKNLRIAMTTTSGKNDINIEDELWSFFNNVKNGIDITLSKPDGEVIFGIVRDQSALLDTLKTQDVVRMQKSGETIVCIASGWIRIGSHNYILSIERDMKSIFVQYDSLVKWYMLIYLLLIPCAAALSFVVARKLTKPLSIMADTLQSYANGNLSKRMTLTTQDEIGQLSVCANRMADTIQDKLQKLSEAAEQKDLFMASFAHEIKTPLTSVIGYAELLERKRRDDELTHTAARYIWSEGMRLEALSLKLTQLFLIDKSEFSMMQMDTNEIQQDLLETLPLSIGQSGINISIELQHDFVSVEPDLLKTLILNLLENARKAGANHIDVVGAPDKARYLIKVCDNGCGMCASELSNITQPFYMVDKARSRSNNGSGLGLALSLRIAKLHGGTLEFESQVGRGTQVEFSVTRSNA